MTDLTGAGWRKSTRSGDNGGYCVEVAANLPGIVAVRDSKDPDAPALTLAPQAWSAFTAAAQSRSHADHSSLDGSPGGSAFAVHRVKVWRFRRSQERTWAANRRKSPASRHSSTRRPGIGPAGVTGWPR
ncbi:hypothetical protein GCM10023176_05070 [Micromonospora coerulea]|uniref:DUF397 domain-containing protein n=1 Tax=Micromonospora coerulea TaxID=47856 RepID=A0ABP8S5F4_9ACTN